jgi:hypothetical protein
MFSNFFVFSTNAFLVESLLGNPNIQTQSGELPIAYILGFSNALMWQEVQ